MVENVQLLRRSAEDAKRDAKQWSALSAESERTVNTAELGSVETDGATSTYNSDSTAETCRLIDVFRAAIRSGQATEGSAEISTMVQQLCEFQLGVLSVDTSTVNEPYSGVEVPEQEQLRSIKAQQKSASREREKLIQGIQSQAVNNSNMETNADCGGQCRLLGVEDSSEVVVQRGPSTTLHFGESTCFSACGKQQAEIFTLNKRQSIALRLICQHLDQVQGDESRNSQLCQFIGGEGGTGKSRIIEAIVQVFAAKGMSHRLLVTATSGAAAARINGVTIHSACRIVKDSSRMSAKNPEGFTPSAPADLFIDGQTRMNWQEKYMLIIDEVSMLGARTLYLVNQQLQKLRGREQDFGGIPVVLFCGDFHQFRPVQDRPIVLPSTEFPWHKEKTFRIEQRHQHDKAYALWEKFTTVIMLNEQVRAAGDPRLRRLLTRIRQGIQDQSDVDTLNETCYQENRRIPWESDITAVTPLNKNRWNLILEATLSFQRRGQEPVHIFISEHKWKDGVPTDEEALNILGMGDDSSIPVPGIFLFVRNMPLILNENTFQGLKAVNGAEYDAVEIIVDRAYPGHLIGEGMILHYGPPAGIIVSSRSTRDFHFVGLPQGTILLTPITTKINCQRKRPWQKIDVYRRGLPCTAGFACTDYKVEGRTLAKAALELRGTGTVNIGGEAIPTRCDPYTLYVQLSRCKSLDGIILLSKARASDFIGNRVPDSMIAAEERLETLSNITIRRAETSDW